MKRLSIEQILPGMVLSSGAKNQHGQMLLAQGTTLEEKHVRILKSWGVLEVEVVDAGDAAASAAETEIPADILNRAGELEEQRFILVDRAHPALTELYQLARVKTAKRLWRESHAS